MASTTDFSKLKNRMLSLEESYDYDDKEAIFNLALCGFYSNPELGHNNVTCHKCDANLQNLVDHELKNMDTIYDLHRESCQYYHNYNAFDSPIPEQDVRVPRSTSFSYVDSLYIRVLVGKEPEIKEFSVHEGLICPRSEFFRKAMNGRWKEANERMVPLPEDDPDIFSLYLKLLYTGKIPVKDIGSDPTHSITVADEYTSLSKLFVLSEKLMDGAAKEVVLAAMLARSKEPFPDKQLYYPALDCVQIIYEGTPEQSPARQLLVQLYTDFGNADFITEKAEAVPKDFLYDLSLSTLRNRVTLKQHNEALKECNSVKERSAKQEKELLTKYESVLQSATGLRIETNRLQANSEKVQDELNRLKQRYGLI